MGVYRKLNRPIAVVPFDPNWPRMFDVERRRIARLLGDTARRIEHFGSTSIPGIAAKPVIDIAIAVARLDDGRDAIPTLEAVGYAYEPVLQEALPDRLFLWKGTPLEHTYHLSITEDGSAL